MHQGNAIGIPKMNVYLIIKLKGKKAFGK